MNTVFAFLLSGAILLSGALKAEAQTFAPSDAIENKASGVINWTVGEVYATGIGAPPPYPANAAQSRAMSERAAFLVAIRNLLEAVKEVRVDSETVVENFMVKSDVIRTKVDGIVKGARIHNTRYLSDGSVEVVVSMPMRGAFMNTIVPETFGRSSTLPAPQRTAVIPQKPSDIIPSLPGRSDKKIEPAKPEPSKPTPLPPSAGVVEPKKEPAKQALAKPEPKSEPVKAEIPQPATSAQSHTSLDFKGGVATGLVIDARGLGLRPALLPKVVDPDGQEIYVGQVTTRTNAVEQGVAGYAKDVSAAANNFRVTDNPAVIKALRSSGTAKTDIMIGQSDAEILRQLSSNGEFLQYCRVIIVY